MTPTVRSLPALLVFTLFVARVASAQWTQTSGPPGGPLHALAAADGALLGTSASRLFRFSGGAWTVPEVPLVGRLLASGADVFAARGRGWFLRSTDAGVTFDSVSAPSSRAQLLSLDASALVANAFDSLFVSTDRGATWSAHHETAWVTVGSSTFEVNLDIRDATAEGNAVLAAGAAYVFGGVFRLAPGDTTWVRLLHTGQNSRVDDLARFGGRLFAASTAGVYVSDDGGATWTPLSAGLPTGSGPSVELYPTADALYAHHASAGFFRLDGTSWTLLPAPPFSFPLAVAASDRLYASDIAVVYAWDGAAWTALPAHLGSSPSMLEARGATATARSEGRLWRTTDAGDTWAAMAPTGVGASLFAPPLAVASTPSGIRRSSDDGATWVAGGTVPLPPAHTALRPTTFVAQSGAFWAAYSFRRFGKHGIPLETFGGVYRSGDGGASWTDATANLPPTTLGPAPVDALFAAGDRLFALVPAGCFTSTGGSWTMVACPGPSVRALVLVGGRWLALAGDDLRASDDQGITWELATAGLPLPTDPTALARFWSSARMASLPGGSAFLVAEVDGTVRSFIYHSHVWEESSLVFPGGITWMGFTAGGDVLYGGSLGRGAWRAPLAIVTAIEPPGSDGPALALSLPAPSPARGVVHLGLSLAHAQGVKAAVYDALGRRVAVLHDGPLAAGTHRLTLDAARLAPGVYVVRAEGTNVAVGRRLVVVR
ncbi:MAG TPA: hypothetical protein VD962_06110 [Rubricoccaceae bacterium]|nr:hypothetical protein [Rubricoccaceae bacterium]